MNIDVFQTPGYFPSNNDPGCTYTLLTSINFLPVIGSFFCDLEADKAYKVVNILYSNDQDRTIVITVPQTISVKHIFDIPGEHPSSTIDIFVGSGKIPTNSGGFFCGYGLVVSVDFVPAIHSTYCWVALNRVYEVTDVLYAIGQDRTIVLTYQLNGQSVQSIFDIPGGTVS